MKTVILHITEEEAASFLMWQKYRANFSTLLDCQVFQIKNGYAQIHFDKLGDIGSIDLHSNVFRKVDIHMSSVDKSKKVLN